MTGSSGKENRQRIIISAVMLVVIFAITLVVLVRIVNKTEDHALLKLKDEARDADFKITMLIDDTYNALNSISSVITSHYRKKESSEIAQTMSTLQVGKLAMNVRLYYPNGGALTENGFIEDVSPYVNYNSLLTQMKDGRYISCCRNDYVNPDEQVIEVFSLVQNEEEKIVIVSAVLNMESLLEYMNSETSESSSDIIFVDTRDGNIFLDTFNGKTGNFIEFKDRENKKGQTLEAFVDSVMEGEETYTTLKGNSTKKNIYLYAVPSRIEGWEAIIFIEENIAFADSISIGMVLFQLVAVEILIFLAYFIWMVKSARKQVIDESKNLISQMMGYDGLFLINLSDDSRKTIYNYRFSKKEFKDDEKYSELFSKYINKYVFEADREELLEYVNLKHLKEFFKTEKELTVQYRDISKGTQQFCEMRFVKVSGSEILQSIKEDDGKIIDKLLLDRMKDDYFALISVDLDAGIIRVIKKSPWYHMGEVGEVFPYTPIMMSFSRALEGKTREFFEKMSDPQYFKKRLEKEDKLTYVYKSNIVIGAKWVNVTGFAVTRNIDNEPSLCALGFSLLDEDASNIQEYQARLNEDMQMIGGLASEYHTLYFYNVREDIFKVYTLDGQRYPELALYVNEEKKPLDRLKDFGKSELVHPDDRSQFDNLSWELVKNKLAHSKKYTLRFRRKFHGEYMWLEMDVIKYEDIDEAPNAIAIGFAIRDKEIREEQRRQQELEEARVAADAANVSKTNFLFNMSHDIRTPLNAITGFTQMAQKSIEDKNKVKEYLEKIDISGQQLVALINQVLEMARIESGTIDLIEKPVNIYDKFNALVTILAEQTRANGQDFIYSISDIEHDMILADEARMGSIALNIVGNAMKYTPKGGQIRFDLQEIAPRKEGYASYLFTVSDTGIGMSKEFLDKLFEPFSREKTSTVSKIQGTGLGMSIVKNIVDLMGGTIEVNSEIGKGSRFDITLDFKIVDYVENIKSDKTERKEISFEGRRALVVEDNEMNREIIKYILLDKGVSVEEAEDGDIALKMLREVADRKDYFYYDFVLMDIQMPRMNGYEATRAIREIQVPKGVRLPIIAMTANAFEEDRKNAIDSGMDEHVAKPINVQVLFNTLSKFLK